MNADRQNVRRREKETEKERENVRKKENNKHRQDELREVKER